MQRRLHWLAKAGIAMACVIAPAAFAQGIAHGSTGQAPQLNASKINHSQLTRLRSTVPLRTLTSKNMGAMPMTAVIPSMTLLLKRSPNMQKKFEAYVNSLHNASSGHYHQWLTAAQIGTMFGPNKHDVATVEKWLGSQGLRVLSVSPTRMSIRFAGPVAAVQRAFHTRMDRFRSANGKLHFANTTDQQIPAALQPVVAGVQSLNNFFPKPQVHEVGTVKRNRKGQWIGQTPGKGRSPDFNVGYQGQILYDVAPADFNVIYNTLPLWNNVTNPVRGAGQTIAVLERSNVQDEDVATFRSVFLPADATGQFTQVHPAGGDGSAMCADPGTTPDEGEAALDAEWAGAAAPDANVMLASCADTGASFGPMLAAQNLLDDPTTPPPAIMSLSYGECEPAALAVGDSTAIANLWAQAAAEGVTVFISSGDSGSAGCDQNQAASFQGLAINAFAASPFAVAVGGTDFDDFQNYAPYWARGNFALGRSALGYIPEQTWNNTCASKPLYTILGFSDPTAACNSATGQNFLSTAAGGGGPSTNFFQPSWQTGVYGTPQIHDRVTPDVALFSASGLYGHALLYCMSDASVGGTPCNYLNPQNVVFNSAGGTSFAAPAMAGIQALINQNADARHGNMNPILSNFGRKEYGSVGSPNTSLLTQCASSTGSSDKASCVFNDVTVGDIDVPCYAGSDSCFSKGTDSYGVLSAGGNVILAPAWETSAGYDYATGLGTINVTNLVNAVAAYDKTAGYAAAPWSFNGSIDQGALNDGYSDTMLVNKSGGAVSLAMNGGTVLSKHTGVSLGAGYQLKAVITLAGGIFSATPTQPYLVVDNTSKHTLKLMTQLFPFADTAFVVDDSLSYVSYAFKYPKHWSVVGSGDMNGDGHPDLFLRNRKSGNIGWISFTCDLEFDLSCSHSKITRMHAPKRYNTPRLADLNGDGYTDLVWTNGNKRKSHIHYWINRHNGNFHRTNGGTYPSGWTLVGAGSINGDHDSDLIWFNAGKSKFRWWTMHGAKHVKTGTTTVTQGYSIAGIEDFDGDGLADLLFANAAGDAYVWEGTGNGGFVSQRVADGTGAAISVPAGYTVQTNRVQGVQTLPAPAPR